ncbi:MAG TPA: hypothetical protein VEQ37_03555 [Actinomycetota bacterium]|nr:hypothetical protein [Actinomycetota bacterium]
MPLHDELSVLLRTARQLSKLCQQGAGLVEEARDRDAPEQVMAAPRSMHSELLRTKHAVEDELRAFFTGSQVCDGGASTSAL